MTKIRTLSLTLLTLAMQATLLQVAYAEKTYQAKVVKGDVVLKINEAIKKYKKGESFLLKSGSVICYKSGNGKVEITGKKIKKRLTKKTGCQSTPSEKCHNKKCKPDYMTMALAKIKNMVTEGGTSSIAGASTRGVGNASGKTKEQAKPRTSIKLIDLEGDKYVYIENTLWTANRHTLPITLEVVTNLEKQETKEKKFTSNSMGTTQFLIPWVEIEDKNNPAQSYYLKVINKRNNVIMDPVRLILNP